MADHLLTTLSYPLDATETAQELCHLEMCTNCNVPVSQGEAFRSQGPLGGTQVAAKDLVSLVSRDTWQFPRTPDLLPSWKLCHLS